MYLINRNCIVDVMASVLSPSAVYRQPKTMHFVVAASPRTPHQCGVGAKNGGSGIMLICPSGATCLPADYCFTKLAL